MPTRLLRTGLLAALLLGSMLIVVLPASAGCHVAGFVEETVEGDEAVGEAVLIVELRGRVASCAGTVDVASVDGTATAGSDYEAVAMTLSFTEGDDRIETIDLVLLDDDEAEGPETFTLELSNPTGGISSTDGPATVTINDDDGATDPADAPTQAADAATELDGDGVAGDGATGTGGNALVVIVITMAVIAGAAFMGRRGRAG